MQPPLTSLSWIDWAVFSDFCSDYRPKAEPFARKVVRSLRKMEAVGCDPRMLLLSSGRYWGCTNRLYSPKQEWQLGVSCWCFRCDNTTMLIKSHSVFWQATPKGRFYTHFKQLAGSPADLPKPLQDSRLAWKFWKCVNRRALGIKDSVLEGLV